MALKADLCGIESKGCFIVISPSYSSTIFSLKPEQMGLIIKYYDISQ